MSQSIASPFTLVAAHEQRAAERFNCNLTATYGSRASTAQITDISLVGCFLQTEKPPAESETHALVFAAGEFGRIVAEAEVVRSCPDGAGLKFTKLPSKASRRLRRLVADLNAIEGHRTGAASLQDQKQGAYSVDDPKKVRAILEQAASKDSRFTLIPAARNCRVFAKLISASAEGLSLQLDREGSVDTGDDVFVLFTLGYDSYSFATRVISTAGEQSLLAAPAKLAFSERRSLRREKPADDAVVSLSVPWQDQPAEWPVYDVSDGGFAMRVASGNALFLPGTPLQDAVIRIGAATTPLPRAVVKHVTHVREQDGREWWKIGVSRGVDRNAPDTVETKIAPEAPHSAYSRFRHWVRDLGDKATYLYHTKIGTLRGDSTLEPFQVVHLENADGRGLVGLLNTSFPSNARVRAPMVVVVPAFGSRKETMSAFAQTLTHNFRRQGKDIAVLRLDGVNNLGESQKDAGLYQDGKQTMHYTVSDGVSDVLGAISWARRNPYVEATEVILVSVSFSSVAARIALTRPEAATVSGWIAYMGAADVQNSIMNVAGNYDAWGNYVRGIQNGVVTLQGCMVDGDRFCADIDELQAATVEDARRDLMKLAIPVTWIVGTHDAWMDPSKINDIMSAAAPGDRKIIEVDTGHTPTSSDEALAQFQLMSRLIWSQIHGTDIEAVLPPRGLIAAVSGQEWARVRKRDALPVEDYWRSYLLSDEKHGYDLLRYVPAYRDFAAVQAAEAAPRGKRVLDLGAGTGIIANALLEHEPATLTCADIVESALERLREEFGQRSNVEFVRANADGNARTAMRRWIRGELSSIHELVGRMPGMSRTIAEQLASKMDPDLHAVLRGAELDAELVRREKGLPEQLGPLLNDINTLAQTELGLLPDATAISSIKKMPPSVFEGDVGLPFADEAFDSVVCSLLLSYLQHPADCLAECRRVLRPGGTLVVSSMRPDADTSIIYREFIETLEGSSDRDLAADRQELLTAARGLLNKAAQLMRDEKEGRFCFYTRDQLSTMVRRAGFNRVRIRQAYGNPSQAIVVSCRKPKTTR